MNRCPQLRQPSSRWSADELSGSLDRTIIIQIVMASFRKPHELFRFMSEREQTLAQHDRDRWIMGALHDEQRHLYPRDTLIGSELVPHQQAQRHEPEYRRGHVHG